MDLLDGPVDNPYGIRGEVGGEQEISDDAQREPANGGGEVGVVADRPLVEFVVDDVGHPVVKLPHGACAEGFDDRPPPRAPRIPVVVGEDAGAGGVAEELKGGCHADVVEFVGKESVTGFDVVDHHGVGPGQVYVHEPSIGL